MRTWPPMTEEEKSILSLPPALQRRMARLVLQGWKIELHGPRRHDGVPLGDWGARSMWYAYVPYGTAHYNANMASYSGGTLMITLDKMAGEDHGGDVKPSDPRWTDDDTARYAGAVYKESKC